MADAEIDITKDRCPMTFVKVKLKLERMAPGERLRVRLSGGEPLESVPASLRHLGFRITEPRADGEGWILETWRPGGGTVTSGI
ncbi:MAG: sulfurtransferase TusA family protein [Magnetococcales bacterium]|nr:sulfurtransferase TusA family protein [Magnetococcales bacterium]